MPKEIWRPVKGLEGQYEISSLGRCRRLPYTSQFKSRWGCVVEREIKGMILKPHPNIHGYYVISLKHKLKFIHRMIAEAFIPNPENKSEVDHINTIPHDNRIENLRWSTRKENNNNPLTILHYRALRNRPIIQMNLKGEFIQEWKSIKEAARILRMADTTINAVLKRLRKSAKGFVFVYKDEYNIYEDYSVVFERGDRRHTKTECVRSIVVIVNGVIKDVFYNNEEAANCLGSSRSYLATSCRRNANGESYRVQGKTKGAFYLKDLTLEIQQEAKKMLSVKYSV